MDMKLHELNRERLKEAIDTASGLRIKLMEAEMAANEFKEELIVTKGILKKILESNTPIESPVHTLHPSHYTVLFAQSILDNDLDVDRAKIFLGDIDYTERSYADRVSPLVIGSKLSRKDSIYDKSTYIITDRDHDKDDEKYMLISEDGRRHIIRNKTDLRLEFDYLDGHYDCTCMNYQGEHEDDCQSRR